MTDRVQEKKYTVPEAAERLGLAPKTVWKRIASKTIGVYRIGRAVRIGESEITRILNDGFTPAESHGS